MEAHSPFGNIESIPCIVIGSMSVEPKASVWSRYVYRGPEWLISYLYAYKGQVFYESRQFSPTNMIKLIYFLIERLPSE